MEQNHNRTSVFTMPLIRVIMLIMLVLFIINQNFLPAGLIIFVFFILALARLWSKFSLRDLEIKHSIFPIRLFPNEETTLKIEINNKKWLPVNIRWIQPVLPEILESFHNEEKQCDLSGHKLLGRNDKISGRYRLKAVKRGYYNLPPFVIQAQDGLGLFENSTSQDNPAIIVYPRIRSIDDLELNPSDLIGDRKDKRPLLPDPIRIAGLRDYTPDMPARYINWKASAHKDELLAKLLEPSADLRICIAVDVESFSQPLPNEEAFEEALSVAASLAYWAENNKIPFALIIDGKQKGLDCPVVIPMSGASNHIGGAFEALARLELIVQGKLSDLIKMESTSFPWGTTLVVIANGLSLPVVSSLRNVVYYNID
jgi:uncharacterized protein (DUF58 family)